MFPVPAPTRSELAADAFATRVRAWPGSRGGRPDRIPPGNARGPHGSDVPHPVPCCSPPARGAGWPRPASTSAIRATAHHRGATVNDALVSAIAGALHTFLDSRGEVPHPW